MGPIDSEQDYDNYFVNTMSSRISEDSADIVKEMAIAIHEAEAPCRILYSGHIGSGKSTELFRLRTELERKNHLVCYANIEDYLDLTTLKHTDLFIFVLESLLTCAKDKGFDVKEGNLKRIREYLETVGEKNSTSGSTS